MIYVVKIISTFVYTVYAQYFTAFSGTPLVHNPGHNTLEIPNERHEEVD